MSWKCPETICTQLFALEAISDLTAGVLFVAEISGRMGEIALNLPVQPL